MPGFCCCVVARPRVPWSLFIGVCVCGGGGGGVRIYYIRLQLGKQQQQQQSGGIKKSELSENINGGSVCSFDCEDAFLSL